MSKEGYEANPVVSYIRSAKLQGSELDDWESQIRTYAAQRGYNLAAIIKEKGVSGATTHKPKLKQLLRAVNAGQYVGVIVPSLSHFSTNPPEVRRLVAAFNESAWIECIKLE